MADLTPLDRKEAGKFVMNHFIVTGSKAGKFSTFRLSVCCKTIDDALRLTRREYPDCTVKNITHQGAIEVMENS